MTIDIRANVTCSLGELIEGSISDGYIQGGLVFISGDCTIKGLLTPAMGTVVTFSYERDGVTTQIPRQLRVLSSFADPFRNTTQVALGCTLTYLRDAKPLPEDAETEDPEEKLAIRTPEELSCKYPDAEIPQYPGIPGIPGQPAIPSFFNASAIFSECCARLGIAGSAALSARYFVDEFNYSSGYVNVISQLLETESLVGFMTSAGLLQTRSLGAGGGTGPLLDGDNVIDIAPIGLGELIPGRVVVRFNSLRLKPIEEDTVDPEDPGAEGDPEADPAPVYDNWERVQTIGQPTEISIYYKHPFTGAEESASTRFIPWSETITTYGDAGGSKPVFNQETCQWEKEGTGPDLSNSVIKRETRTKRMLAEANGNYCSEVLSTLQVYYLPGAIFPIGQIPLGYGQNRRPPLTLDGYSRTVETFEYDEEGNVVKTIVETYEPYFAFIGRLDIQYIYYGLSEGRTTIDQLPMNAFDVLVQRVITTVRNVYATGQLRVSENQAYVAEPIDNPYADPLGQRVKVETWVNNAITQSGQQAIATFKKNGAFRTLEGTQSKIQALMMEMKLEDMQVEVTRDRQLLNPPRRPTKQQLSSATKTEATATGDSEATTNADQQGRIENAEQFEVVVSGNGSKNVLDTSLPLSPDDVYGVNGQVINGQGSTFARRYGRALLRLIYGRRYGLNMQLPPGKMPAQPYSPLYLTANGFTVQYRANGTNWAFSSDGVACSTDGLYMGVVGGSGTPWVPVAPGVTEFPPAPEPTYSGEIDPDAPIPPYSERVYVATGLRLGATSQVLPYSLAPVEVTATPRLRLGAFMSPDTQRYAAPGCKLGTAVLSNLATIKTVTPGLALGTGSTSTFGALQTARPGIRVGLRGGIDPEYEYVLALLRMNGQNYYSVFTDESRYARTVNVLGSTYTDATTKKYGSASGAFKQTTPYGGLTIPADPAFVLGADNFTIETWVRMSSLSGAGYQTIVSYGSAFEGAWYFAFFEGTYVGNGPYLAFLYQYLDNTNTLQFDGQLIDFSSFSLGTWYHLAVVRNGANGVIYVNGVAQTDLVTSTTTHDYASRVLSMADTAPQLTVGFSKNYSADTSYTDFFYGRMDDLRITRGVARYTANFTPPTAELPAS
jgi:hypothetical protein